MAIHGCEGPDLDASRIRAWPWSGTAVVRKSLL